MSGSGISWAICKSAPRSRQITTPAPHRSVFYRPDALPAAQPTSSKYWRQKLQLTCSKVVDSDATILFQFVVVVARWWHADEPGGSSWSGEERGRPAVWSDGDKQARPSGGGVDDAGGHATAQGWVGRTHQETADETVLLHTTYVQTETPGLWATTSQIYIVISLQNSCNSHYK